MKDSPYIAWAKHHHHCTYNLASSGVADPPVDVIGFCQEDLDVSGEHVEGWPGLLERIAARYGVAPDNVVLAQGTSMANHLVCALLLEPGDGVLVETPCYEPLHRLPRFFHAQVRFFRRRAEDGYRLDAREVERLIDSGTRLLVCSNLHNPTGKLAPREDLEALGRLAEAHGFHVLVDEVYLEWLHEAGESTAALLGPRFITTRSLTKAYGLDALRAGWIVADNETAARLRRLVDLFFVFMPHPAERMAARALDRTAEIMNILRPRLERNLRLVSDFVAAHPELSWTQPDGGTVAFVRLARGSVDDLEQRLAAMDTAVAPGRFFGAPDCFRLGMGMPSEVLAEGLRRLSAALSASSGNMP